MGVRETPGTSWEVCDRCASDEQHVPEEFGAGSIDVEVKAAGRDFHGVAAIVSSEFLLCRRCRAKLAAFLKVEL